MIRRLLLWDVDGTLVRAGDLGAAVFDLALEQVLGVRPEAHVRTRVRMSGKTDPQIVREYLVEMGLKESPELIETVLRCVEAELAAAAGDLEGTASPGVPAILAELARHPTVLSTLVTGTCTPTH
jgi:phosphoglycolate phosphatase-like HAD superfamily hydrolase